LCTSSQNNHLTNPLANNIFSVRCVAANNKMQECTVDLTVALTVDSGFNAC